MNASTIGTQTKCPECGADLISAEQAADIIGISYARIRAILASDPDRLRAFKIGKTWVIPEHSAKKFERMAPHRPRRANAS